MKKNDIVTLKIEQINNLGYGVAHVTENGDANGLVVFVSNAVTGDVVDARIIKVNKSYLIARIERLIVESPLRSPTACPAAGCGGCVYKNILYEHELELKQDYVKNAFRKAGLLDVAVEPVLSNRVVSGYRNKAQYPVGHSKGGIIAGFYANGTHRIVHAPFCDLQPPLFGQILEYICAFCDYHKLRAYDEESGKGLLRHVYLRNTTDMREVMVCLVLNAEGFPLERKLAEGIAERFPNVKSVMVNVNTEKTNVILGERYRLIYGREWIEDTLCGLHFRISAGAFYQVNHDMCEMLYQTAAERAALRKGSTVLDLYCGIGTIGLSMAEKADKVIGIEIVEEAVACAKENAKLNGIANAYFYHGDATQTQKLLENAERVHGDVSDAVVIMDPPRKGSTPELIAYLAKRKFSRIVYVSCNPDTLARDCALFRDHGYAIGTVTPVDMFPRTGHVESVVCLTRK